jgi:hypothetical protein
MEGDWRDPPNLLLRAAPPHGQRSELEICGLLDNSLVVRVDQAIYGQMKQPLWGQLRDLSFWQQRNFSAHASMKFQTMVLVPTMAGVRRPLGELDEVGARGPLLLTTGTASRP